jgi:hypothetical protein
MDKERQDLWLFKVHLEQYWGCSLHPLPRQAERWPEARGSQLGRSNQLPHALGTLLPASAYSQTALQAQGDKAACLKSHSRVSQVPASCHLGEARALSPSLVPSPFL